MFDAQQLKANPRALIHIHFQLSASQSGDRILPFDFGIPCSPRHTHLTTRIRKLSQDSPPCIFSLPNSRPSVQGPTWKSHPSPRSGLSSCRVSRLFDKSTVSGLPIVNRSSRRQPPPRISKLDTPERYPGGRPDLPSTRSINYHHINSLSHSLCYPSCRHLSRFDN